MTRAFRSGARPSPTKAEIDDQKKAKVKRAFRSDDAYRVEAKKGGKMKKKKSFPDMSGDGKVTKKDILIARGVIKKPMKKKK